MAPYAKPLPTIGRDNEPFWAAAKQHELRHPKCRSCGLVWGPPSGVCPHCLSEDVEWIPLSGKATLVTWGVFHKLYYDAFADDIPYNTALVEFEEGPRLLTTIVDVDNADLRRGMALEAVFDDVTDEVTLVKFRPATEN